MEAAKAKVKKYLGQAANAQGWQTIGDVGVEDGVRWLLYVNEERKNGRRNMKARREGLGAGEGGLLAGVERRAAGGDERS